jgi:4a-hydroxytetrahydrobiopterin dehydratase
MKSVPGWRRRGKMISRTFTFRTFLSAVGFVDKVARLAERAFHHPDIDIRYNRVKLGLTTHDYGGLTMRDFNLARRVNKLYDKTR